LAIVSFHASISFAEELSHGKLDFVIEKGKNARVVCHATIELADKFCSRQNMLTFMTILLMHAKLFRFFIEFPTSDSAYLPDCPQVLLHQASRVDY
jgi:hypothetical protein